MKLFLYFVIFSSIIIVEGNETIKKYEWYDEDLIVNKFLPMASAAFGEKLTNFEGCIKSALGSGGKLINNTTVDCSGFNEPDDKLCAAMIAVSESNKAVILSFRGTQNPIQFLDMIGGTFYKQREAAPAGKANFYFQLVVEKFEATGLFTKVKKTMEENPLYELWVTGASLGGALASLGAGWLVKKYQVDDKNMKLVTFAAPRTGNSEWAKAMDQIIPYKYRIVQGLDIVPHIPLQATPAITVEIGQLPSLIATENVELHDYLHFKGEIWYPEGTVKGKFLLCNGTNEDPNCSNRNYKLLDFSGPAAVIRKFARDCENSIKSHKFKLLGFDFDPLKELEKIKDLYFQIVGTGIAFAGDKIKELTDGLDIFANDMYKCVNGMKNGIPAEHNTYFGIDFKQYGGKGCPQNLKPN